MDSCIDPHCVLCTLELKDGDAILCVLYKEEKCLREDKYYPCVISNCRHQDGLAQACHLSCAKEGVPSLEACRVTSWDPDFEGLIVRSAHPERELKHSGASRLDLARLTLQAEEKITKASRGEVGTSSCIWATYAKLHGETYVSTLSNIPTDLLYDPKKDSTANVIYVARGPLGVKKVVFACSTEILETKSCPWDWWQALPLSEGCRLQFDFDGLKIRNLRIDQHGDCKQPLWSVPIFRPELVRFPLSPSKRPPRFNRVMVNDPGTTGYSVAWNPARRALRLVRHTAGDGVSCYANMPDDSITWLYIPISHGELLADIWRRDCDQYFWKHVDLIIVTTTGRVHVLGKHPTPGQAYTYSRIAKLRSEPDYLYIDESKGIRELALNPAPEINDAQILHIPTPLSRYPAITSVESYFYTFVRLENLDSIRLCNFNRTVTGLLLHYHDSSRATLGQVRLDRLGAEQRVPCDATIRFVILRKPDQCPCVSNVRVFTAYTPRNLLPAATDLDFEITCHGILEWWYTRRQCQLAHNGRTSASTRI